MSEVTYVYALRVEPGREGKVERYQHQLHAGSEWFSQSRLDTSIEAGGSIYFDGRPFQRIEELNEYWRQNYRDP